MRPKHHCLYHLGRDVGRTCLNPRALSCWSDESFLGYLKRIGVRCHQLGILNRLYQRYILFLSLRWHKAGCQSAWRMGWFAPKKKAPTGGKRKWVQVKVGSNSLHKSTLKFDIIPFKLPNLTQQLVYFYGIIFFWVFHCWLLAFKKIPKLEPRDLNQGNGVVPFVFWKVFVSFSQIPSPPFHRHAHVHMYVYMYAYYIYIQI